MYFFARILAKEIEGLGFRFPIFTRWWSCNPFLMPGRSNGDGIPPYWIERYGSISIFLRDLCRKIVRCSWSMTGRICAPCNLNRLSADCGESKPLVRYWWQRFTRVRTGVWNMVPLESRIIWEGGAGLVPTAILYWRNACPGSRVNTLRSTRQRYLSRGFR